MAATAKFDRDLVNGFSCHLRSPLGYRLTVSGTLADIEPSIDGHERMLDNPALIHNAWAYAKNERRSRDLPTGEQKDSHRKQAEAHAKTAKAIARYVDCLTTQSREGWCSGCYARTDHRRVDMDGLTVPTYLCVGCGTPTLRCASPNCSNMATRKLGAVRVPRFCAEHRHEIPGFKRATMKVASLDEYSDLLTFDRVNLARASKIAVAGAAVAGVVATGGLMAAPAIGGAIGSLTGLSGAAASSYGLALLGGGSIAAGGMGMAGGTYVVAALGAALGSALGASVTNAYVSEDKSFEIVKFIGGPGTPVLVARGFTTQNSLDWASAMDLVEQRYPDSPIYRLHWGSKELGELGKIMLKNVGVAQFAGAVGVAAAKASKSAKLGPLAPAVLAADLLKNPWHTARVRADRTGVALAGILAHTELENVILVGHSLGGRAMITAAETLGTSKDGPTIEAVHVLGGAESRPSDSRPLSEAVSGSVHNYHSTNDKVLRYLFTVAEPGGNAVGLNGFRSNYSNIIDHDVSSRVAGHSDYFDNVSLV